MNPQARLGAFVLIAVILLGILSAKIGRMNFGSEHGLVVESVFDDVAGLEEQTAVRMAGVRVGSVESIALEGNRALVRMRLVPDIMLPVSTRARLISGGLVGEKFLSLSADPGDNSPLPHGQRIPSTSAGGISSFISQAGKIADDIHQISLEGQGVLQNISGMLDENRVPLKDTIAHLQSTSKSLDKQLPPTLEQMHQASSDIATVIARRKKDMDRSLRELPLAIDAGKRFFNHSDETMQKVSVLLDGNRENLYRMIFEMRRTAENLEAMSDDLRRNPWKLTNKTREVPPSPRAKQEKMEEMMLSTGRMGLAPARR